MLVLEGRTRSIHRVVCERSHGAPPFPAAQAAHACGNSLCVNPGHIRWASRAENAADKVIHGTHNYNRGERNVSHKLTEVEVGEIKTLWLNGGMTQGEIANRYGVARTTVGDIVRGESWQYLR